MLYQVLAITQLFVRVKFLYRVIEVITWSIFFLVVSAKLNTTIFFFNLAIWVNWLKSHQINVSMLTYGTKDLEILRRLTGSHFVKHTYINDHQSHVTS